MKKFLPLIKTVLYPSLLLAAHSVAENWHPIIAALGPHFAWLGGPAVVAIGATILHQIESPTKGN